ncbi:uncharacterized protein LOC120444748 [Drosophila santomea]|uniref:uncharacterized protein LOC120444748 n=1 Tax=Drosophila santomea TaxID=129105 RepID=UPI001CCB2935|nr:uncharacterized protein LOC120444748 [Drosophila santomea]
MLSQRLQRAVRQLTQRYAGTLRHAGALFKAGHRLDNDQSPPAKPVQQQQHRSRRRRYKLIEQGRPTSRPKHLKPATRGPLKPLGAVPAQPIRKQGRQNAFTLRTRNPRMLDPRRRAELAGTLFTP